MPDQQVCTLSLERDHHLQLPARSSWLITCRTGLVWITQEDSLDDWVLRSGESMQLHGTSILIGALRTSRLQLTSTNPAVIRPISAFKALASLLARRLLNHPGNNFML